MRKNRKNTFLKMVQNCSFEDCFEDPYVEKEILIGKLQNGEWNLPYDLSYRDLRTINLPINLHHRNLEGANLEGVDFQIRILPNKIRHANLRFANLLFVKNIAIDFSYSDLTGAKLPKNLSKSCLRGAIMDGLDLTNHILPMDLRSTSFINARLPKNLSYCNLQGANLTNIDLSLHNLPSNLSFTTLDNTKLPENTNRFNLVGTCYEI